LIPGRPEQKIPADELDRKAILPEARKAKRAISYQLVCGGGRMNARPKVFISYSSADRPHAERLVTKQAHLEACDSPKEIFLDFRSQNLLARYQRPFYSL